MTPITLHARGCARRVVTDVVTRPCHYVTMSPCRHVTMSLRVTDNCRRSNFDFWRRLVRRQGIRARDQTRTTLRENPTNRKTCSTPIWGVNISRIVSFLCWTAVNDKQFAGSTFVCLVIWTPDWSDSDGPPIFSPTIRTMNKKRGKQRWSVQRTIEDSLNVLLSRVKIKIKEDVAVN